MSFEMQLAGALSLIASTPGYGDVATELGQKHASGSLVFDPSLPDRGLTGLGGKISIGPEAAGAGPLGLAETLIHERVHTGQSPLLKTVSFWKGVVGRRNPMSDYERPAYTAAIEFLRAVAASHPELADDAFSEIEAIQAAFSSEYGQSL